MTVFTDEKASALGDDGMRFMADICDRCPVLELCRAYAIAGEPEHGWWAGAPASRWRKAEGAPGALTAS